MLIEKYLGVDIEFHNDQFTAKVNDQYFYTDIIADIRRRIDDYLYSTDTWKWTPVIIFQSQKFNPHDSRYQSSVSIERCHIARRPDGYYVTTAFDTPKDEFRITANPMLCIKDCPSIERLEEYVHMLEKVPAEVTRAIIPYKETFWNFLVNAMDTGYLEAKSIAEIIETLDGKTLRQWEQENAKP